MANVMKAWERTVRQVGRAGVQFLPHHAKVGLFDDDIRHADEPHVREALRRLPPDVYAARKMRIHHAIHMSMAHKQQTPEEAVATMDRNQPYLDEYLDEVVEERVERAEFRS